VIASHLVQLRRAARGDLQVVTYGSMTPQVIRVRPDGSHVVSMTGPAFGVLCREGFVTYERTDDGPGPWPLIVTEAGRGILA
jgi:hypothetical protein